MRPITEQGRDLIKRFEGFSPVVYRDAAGLPTIGYGHLLKEGEAWPQGISTEEAEALLQVDIGQAAHAVERLIAVPLTDDQFAALVSFTFNLGAGALQRSSLRRTVNREEHDAVPHQLMRWVWAGGRKLRGLVRRREAEAAMYVGRV